jgi:hypothetical protein
MGGTRTRLYAYIMEYCWFGLVLAFGIRYTGYSCASGESIVFRSRAIQSLIFIRCFISCLLINVAICEFVVYDRFTVF